MYLQSQKDSHVPPIHARISMTPHDPITIVGNAGFLESSSGVRSGNGDPTDPYIISDWEINATNNIGIYIFGTDVYFIIRNVTINSSAQNNDGILLDVVSNAIIHNVTISDCDTGIAITRVSSSIEIDESSISNSSDHGIVTQYGAASYVNITKNTIYANGGTGIALGSTSHFNVVSNNVSTNDTSSGGRRAVTLIDGANGVVTGNNLTAIYDEALYCSNSQNVIVATNRFSSVWGYGVSLTSCSGFLVYRNNFMGVPPQAFDNAGPENEWNSSYPTGGNFWIDYTGIDEKSGPDQDQSGKDGIGDTDYVIDSNTIDHYPLNMSGPVEPIPEFPTLLLPMISVLALLFAIVRRSHRKEF